MFSQSLGSNDERGISGWSLTEIHTCADLVVDVLFEVASISFPVLRKETSLSFSLTLESRLIDMLSDFVLELLTYNACRIEALSLFIKVLSLFSQEGACLMYNSADDFLMADNESEAVACFLWLPMFVDT